MKRSLFPGGILILLASMPALAVIGIKTPISKVYEAADAVLVGRIASVNAQSRVMDIEIVQAVKGQSPGRQARIQIQEPKSLIDQVRKDQPVVIITGEDMVSVHVADTWLLGEGIENAKVPSWRCTQESPDLRHAFPGKTDALVRVIGRLKEGKPALIDQIENKVFADGWKRIGKLDGQKPAWIEAADVNGDGLADLLVRTEAGVVLLLRTADGFADATKAWGLGGAVGNRAGFGDVNADGKTDLVLGAHLWLNRGMQFEDGHDLGFADKPDLLAIGVVDTNGDNRLDVVALYDGKALIYERDGNNWKQSREIRLLQSGSIASADLADWSEEGRASVMLLHDDLPEVRDLASGPVAKADFYRLTGEKLEAFKGALPNGLKQATARRIDIDRNNKPDYLIFARGGGIMLVNRGFGAFLVNRDAVANLRDRIPDTNTAWTCFGSSIYRVDADGSIFEAKN